MINTNEYSASIHRLPEEKLREYIQKPEQFQDEAVLAAIWELASRRKLLKDEQKLKAEIAKRTTPPESLHPEIYTSEFKMVNVAQPSLYSIRSIQIFSVLFSVLAGGILMAINFNRTSKKQEALKVIGFSLVYTISAMLIFSLLGTQSPVLSIILNLLGAFLIDELFWKRVLGREFRFDKQQVWSALIIALIIISPIIWYVIQSGALQTV
jgi:hypothetical protein